MTWTHYRPKFRLLSPLHVGYRKVGNLMQTRPYVPGKLSWAALTARLTRDDHDGSRGSEYRRIGGLVQQHFRCGYLWPSLDGKLPCFPWECADFDYLLLNSYAATALDYDRTAALDGSLRETEFIAPVARDGRSVSLLGDLWVQEDGLPTDLAGWKKALQHIQLGGERGYGWGRVRLCSKWDDGRTRQGTTIAGYKWQASNGQVSLTIPAKKPLTAHAIAVGSGAISGVVGPVEPLVGWERKQDGRYGLTETAVIAYAPEAMARQKLHVAIGPLGIREAAS